MPLTGKTCSGDVSEISMLVFMQNFYQVILGCFFGTDLKFFVG
jgi:hypothetical protein